MTYRQVTLHPAARIAPNATLVGHVEVADRKSVV